MRIKLDSFEGIVPRVRDRLLGDHQATVAENVDVRNGSIRPVKEPGIVETIGSGQISLYKHNDEFLTFSTDVDVVRGPIIADAFDRIYYTGDGTPKVLGTEGGIQKIFDLGIPKPSAAPIVTAPQRVDGGFIRSWGFFYEEPDGLQVDNGIMNEGTDVIETSVGKIYTVSGFAAKFPKVTASGDAIFVMFLDATDVNTGSFLGRVYGSISTYALNNDFVLNGAAATGLQENTTNAVLTLSYDTSRASEYTVARSYAYTFVSAWGEEGEPSDPSIVIPIDPTQAGQLNGMDTSVAGNFQITLKRIYRTVTGIGGTEFQFVAEIPIGQSDYLDLLADSDTQGILPTTGFDQPPSNLSGIVSLAGGFFAAFVPGSKDIYFSQPNQPHAWPSQFITSVDYKIVGLGAYENSLLVVTEGFPTLITGQTPDFVNIQTLLARQACVSKRSIVNAGNTILYASPDGMIASVGANISIASESLYTEQEWRLTSPETMIGSYSDGRIFMFSDTTSLIFDFDPNRSLLVTTDESISGAYNDIEDDRLYFIQGNQITDWEGGSQNKDGIWRSKRFVFSRVGDFSTCRILADGYPVTLRLFAEGVQVHQQVVPDDESFTLPVLRQEREWNVEFESAFNITEVILADRRGLQE